MAGVVSPFPIDFRRRLYNTLALPCECVVAHNLMKLLQKRQGSDLSGHSVHREGGLEEIAHVQVTIMMQLFQIK